MTYQQIISVEVFCDFPECDEYLLFAWEEAGEKIQIMMRAIGWTSISFPGEKKYEQECLDFCAECKEKDPRSIKEHECIYMRKTKTGKPSEYGSILECYFCGRKKF